MEILENILEKAVFLKCKPCLLMAKKKEIVFIPLKPLLLSFC